MLRCLTSSLCALVLVVTVGCDDSDEPVPDAATNPIDGAAPDAGNAVDAPVAMETGGPSDAGRDLPVDVIYDVAPVPTSIPLAMAPMVFAEVVCEKVFSCCTPEQRARNPLITNQAGCSALVAALLSDSIAPTMAAMAAGRASYEPDVLAGCLRDYQMSSCADLEIDGGLSAYAACPFIKPLVAPGGACSNDIECIDGRCPNGTATMAATCVASKPNGQTCMLDAECIGRCDLVAGTCADPVETGLCSSL